MQTDSVYACNIENNDHIVIDGEVKGYVYMVDEDGDFILLDVVDDDGEHTQYPFGPFDTVTIVASFDDGEEVDIPDFIE
jgi:hypothetical protein